MKKQVYKQLHLEVKSVEFQNYPVGNLWDVFEQGIRTARVTYHDNTLVVTWGKLGISKSKVAKAIEEMQNVG